MPPADPADQLALAEPMRSRWSTRVFDDRHQLGADELELLLHAAQWAPSWGNLQPWAFVVARRGGPAHEALVPRLSRGNSGWVPRASVVLVTAAQVAPDPRDDADDGGFKGAHSACYDLGQAAAHLSLQATAMGLHAHQFAGFDKEGVAQDLGVPGWFRVMTGIAVGSPGDPAEVSERDREREQRPRGRKDLTEFVHVDAWGQPWDRG
ncbi:MAG: nitroreductase family protein [Actinomycetota bacterium]|nr:nitroreductase family protein [Actinomycetota bacterium]